MTGKPHSAPIESTLLELLMALHELTDTAEEAEALALELLREGKVRTTGNFRGFRWN